MTPCESCNPTTIGGYRIENLIGTGGQSEVFAVAVAEQPRSLALKWSREEFDPPAQDAYKAPRMLREKVMEALKGDIPDEYRREVERYFRELTQ